MAGMGISAVGGERPEACCRTVVRCLWMMVVTRVVRTVVYRIFVFAIVDETVKQTLKLNFAHRVYMCFLHGMIGNS